MSPIVLFLKCNPLSDVKYLGTPYCVIKYIRSFATVLASDDFVAFAITYFEL